MTATVEAIYEDGVLRLKEPIPLAEGTSVDVLVLPRVPAEGRQTPAEILAEIAALPIEGKRDPFSGQDHDSVLYGEQGAR